MRKIARYLWLLPRTIAIIIVKIYQQTFSPDHGILKTFYPYGFCRLHPTCSEYAKEMLERKGFIVGLLYTFGRMFHCAPWSATHERRLQSAARAMLQSDH
ncbi:MAG TPA: membrane protein insertion efficiency factor YidD [Candidatus Peribacterales bacterium]|nr:membrane protein insertion efficiency factor YidD [Candidatus Peribacterales bacterium]